VLFLLHNDRPV